ncbi:hypothetical protein [Paenarthrobacter aurescens]|uniref:hypothetical protein n=1 Tax=Paenarthrobacter aurescens TaxID=43663 RepID=UPI0021C1C063|nr:hypothetical protein [Paenarthrobacter aurescens]MCT9870473.1 hypothetical protein [Paenarthrobacter aurescens]
MSVPTFKKNSAAAAVTGLLVVGTMAAVAQPAAAVEGRCSESWQLMNYANMTSYGWARV